MGCRIGPDFRAVVLKAPAIYPETAGRFNGIGGGR
jgi:hypothetical protein